MLCSLGGMAKILIVDDDAAVRAILAQVLKAAGHQVFSATNGKEGLWHFGAIQPDLIITDLFMPEKEGLETITELRKKFPQIGILAMSGGNIASTAMLSVAAHLGASCTLEKPFDKDTLLAAVQRTLRMHRHHPKPKFETVGPILPESH